MGLEITLLAVVMVANFDNDMSTLFFDSDSMFAFEFLPWSKVNGTLMMHLSGAKNCYQIPTYPKFSPSN